VFKHTTSQNKSNLFQKQFSTGPKLLLHQLKKTDKRKNLFLGSGINLWISEIMITKMMTIKRTSLLINSRNKFSNSKFRFRIRMPCFALK